MDYDRRRFIGASAAALTALGPAGRAGTQGGQPFEPVKIVLGFPPGGSIDTLSRRVAENLRGGSFAKTAPVENKPDADGQIAVQSMKEAAS